MSYEGYTRWLCAMGHDHVNDCNDDDEGALCHCGARRVWVREVDETNGDGYDPPLDVAVPAVKKTCDLGHEHVIEPTRYKIPGFR